MPIATLPASLETAMQTLCTAAVEYVWIPLGAGGHSVRFNGRVFEAIGAARGGLLDLVTTMPRPVWGRDELKTGEMWISNSMIA